MERDPDVGRFVSGYVLAGRYRMVALLGKGGMGEVWRAEDLVLETPVALKLIRAADAEGRTQILNEVRLARQITHPAVCRVFDVGEAEGEIFYSMELVRGEDLALLVRRLGRLPREKVIDIGLQLCGGLAAAHAHGVLHRDLKPANVLIDNEGRVRITDFGIAISRHQGDPTQPIGTPGYMAPEQLNGGPLSEQTDVYALGLILYELLVGRPAFDLHSPPTVPPRPSKVIRDVDAQLETAVVKAISANPRHRPASALELLDLLSASGAQAAIRPWVAGSVLAAIVGALALAASIFTPASSPRLSSQDTIILADFLNTTGEPVFDGALKVALAVALEQSPFLKVFPDDRVRATLRLMERAPDERVTRAVAREIARRERFKALVSGSIATLGSHYVLTLEAINAETGDAMAREQVEAQSREQVLTSLGGATSRLREKLGESLALIQRFDAPLAEATTASLEALHAYSLALDQGRIVPRIETVPHLRRAIELDPNFAMAHALLSGVYANTGRSAEAPVFSRRAFELRDRVSERERFFISWRYYMDAEQAWDKALELSRSWTATYPREAFAFNSLGLASGAFGQHDQAISAFREAIRLDAGFVPPHGNLAGVLVARNRFDEAHTLVQQATAHGVDFPTVRRMAFLLGFLRNDQKEMATALALVQHTPLAMFGALWEARAAAFSQNVQGAHALFRHGIDTAVTSGFRELAAQWTMEDAEVHAIAGQCGEARREIPGGLELSRDNFTLERASRALALCDAATESSQLSAELASRFPAATLTRRIQLPVTAAVMALRRGEFARTIELLEPVAPYDYAPASEFWPPYLRAQAYAAMNDRSAAVGQYQSILDHRGAAPTSPLYALARAGLTRIAAPAGDAATTR